ncbi:hypothetical protein Goarm_003216 [Gossypium armourianum]|uniref:Calcium uniporter protein C-terminal domain-containing protein n=1 Tax=Gossypium armourianum TaxID=34283 RepID=A0A7J9K2G1_9ROSI|nr:hypothetical protein [Gossypium armourianum]
MFKKTLVEKLFNISKMSSQALTRCRTSSSTAHNRVLQNVTTMVPDQGDLKANVNSKGMCRQFLHEGTMHSPAIRKLPMGENLMETLRGIGTSKDRIRLEGLSPHLEEKTTVQEVAALSDQEAKKLLRVALLEVMKTRLRETGKNWIPYSNFIRICEECFSDPKLGLESAKLLDESGGVIVLGNLVFLRPEQVAKAVGGLIPLQRPNPNDPRIKQLLEMETQKAKIDSKANSLVRRELWVGLVYLVVQTAGFMRLTFWELSWDVMEPVCFFFTSMYFLAAYTFFLKTSKEPSFEGFYQSRFTTKQKRLIRAHNFDMEKYDKLKSMFYPHSEQVKIGD